MPCTVGWFVGKDDGGIESRDVATKPLRENCRGKFATETERVGLHGASTILSLIIGKGCFVAHDPDL